MTKRYLLFCQLALLPTLAAQAQFTVGADGFFIGQNTQVFIDSLTLNPSVDFSLVSQTLTITPTPIPGAPPSIARVYNLTTPVNFTGVAGFFYRASELNGNTESTLQVNHGNANFVSTTGSTVNVIQHYISNTLPLTNFTSLTAAQEGALPVNLVDFKVKRVENATVLYWQTSEEKTAIISKSSKAKIYENGMHWVLLTRRTRARSRKITPSRISRSGTERSITG